MTQRTPGYRAVLLLCVLAIVAAACTDPQAVEPPKPEKHVSVCDNLKLGPADPPADAVVIDPDIKGDLIAKNSASPPGTTFWLAQGTHILGGGEYGQVAPKDGNRYLGAPGAVLDGREKNRYAFTGKAADVTIAHLTVRGFVSPVNEGVVNHDSGAGWVLKHNLLTENGGAASMAGAEQVMRGNCFKNNGQYGLNACCGSVTDIVLEGNEFVGNNADDVENMISGGCGCTGAMKFWEVDGADIRGNWIHDNRGPGIWADTNNNDFLIEDNLIENNDGSAIFYETSYNATIRDNVIRRNSLVVGKEFVARGDNFPVASIYLSESGGDSRIPARTDKIEVYRNVFENNWSGITLWENADRFCNSPANTSSGFCTLMVDNVSECSQPAIANEPHYSDCRWSTRRVDIHHNQFIVNPDAIDCESMCARMAVLSNYGTVPEWSPYKGDVIKHAITFKQENRWHDNEYIGPWQFMPLDTNHLIGPTHWRGSPYLQDKGSTFTPNRQR